MYMFDMDDMGVYPKMDGENNGNPYEQMDDLGGLKTPIFGSTPILAPNTRMQSSPPG